MKDVLLKENAKLELEKEFNGIDYITSDKIDLELDKVEYIKKFEKFVISKNLNILNSLKNTKNETYNISKNIKSIIKLLEKFILENPSYKFLKLLKQEVFVLGQIYTLIVNKEKPYDEDIELLYELTSQLQNENYISDDISYIYIAKKALYMDLKEKINEELKNDDFSTLLTVLDENTRVYKITRCALNLCKVNFDKKIIEEVIEESILKYDASTSINRHIAKLVVLKYKLKENKSLADEEIKEVDRRNYNLSALELFGHNLNEKLLYNQKDKSYIEFLKLKYGLNNENNFYSIEEIHSILNIDINILNIYYANSINMINILLEQDKKMLSRKK